MRNQPERTPRELIDPTQSAIRNRRVLMVVLITWFVYPLLLGIAGLGVAFIAPDLPILPAASTAQMGAWAAVGVFLGCVLAIVHTCFSYWRNFLK